MVGKCPSRRMTGHSSGWSENHGPENLALVIFFKLVRNSLYADCAQFILGDLVTGPHGIFLSSAWACTLVTYKRKNWDEYAHTHIFRDDSQSWPFVLRLEIPFVIDHAMKERYRSRIPQKNNRTLYDRSTRRQMSQKRKPALNMNPLEPMLWGKE